MHNDKEKAFKKNVNIIKSTLRIKCTGVSFDPSGQTLKSMERGMLLVTRIRQKEISMDQRNN